MTDPWIEVVTGAQEGVVAVVQPWVWLVTEP